MAPVGAFVHDAAMTDARKAKKTEQFSRDPRFREPRDFPSDPAA
jgi:hypothetical protein